MVSILVSVTEDELIKCCGESIINEYKEALNTKLYLEMDYEEEEGYLHDLMDQIKVVEDISENIIATAKKYLIKKGSFDRSLIASLDFELDCGIFAFRSMMVRDVELKGVRDYHYGSN